MEIELHPAVSLLEDTFNVLIAPPELLIDAINNSFILQRYKVLYIGGNYSRILSRLNRNITELDVRRAFTVFQLMTLKVEDTILMMSCNRLSTCKKEQRSFCGHGHFSEVRDAYLEWIA
jgi:DNA polymerase I